MSTCDLFIDHRWKVTPLAYFLRTFTFLTLPSMRETGTMKTAVRSKYYTISYFHYFHNRQCSQVGQSETTRENLSVFLEKSKFFLVKCI